jgi:hypothetical protein
MKKASVVLRIIGIISIVFAVLGFLYNSTTFLVSWSKDFRDKDALYFYPAFYIMSFICAICYSVLLICGIQFIRLRTRLFPLFVGVLIFEFIYIFSIGITWLIPGIGSSIGAATGVANGGLSLQIFILFPLWGSLLAGWASKRIPDSEELVKKTV